MTGPKSGRGVPRLCLIDGSALVYRSYYAFIRNPLYTSRGENVGAVYGFTSSLIKLIEDLEPDYLAVAFDTPEPTFRHEVYEDYKATRDEAPDELVEQFPMVAAVLEALSVPVFQLPRYEADDIIGTLVTKASAAGVESVIVSGDKDFFQLVGEGVSVFDPGKAITYTPDVVEERFGVPPGQVRDALGLMGDASDNVPGVPGIGKKTAVKLIALYGTIEGVIEHVDEIGGAKRRANIEEHGDLALSSRDLVTIVTDAPVDLDLASLARAEVDPSRATELFLKFEFPSLLKKILPAGGPPELKYEIVKTKTAFRKLLRALRESGGFAVDLETTSLDPVSAEIVGVALAHESGGASYVPVGHEGGTSLEREFVLEGLSGLLGDPDLPKFGQNLKFDYEVLRTHGIDMRGIAFDTMIASYLLDPGRRQHGLAALALEHLGRRVTPIEDLIGKGKEQLTFDRVDVDAAADYACEDAEVTFELTGRLRPEIETAGLSNLMSNVEVPLVPILAGMELAGVALDTGLLEDLAKRFGADMESLTGRIYDLSGCEFNIDSPKQVGEVLFERLGLPRGRKTKTGYSTDTRVLTDLAVDHEVPELILSYRQLMKLKAGYVDSLPRLLNPLTGRIHTSFNQTIAATGRLSSSNPNLQNIPMRTDLGREIRRAFVAGPGRVLLSADYSQIELRVMAFLSRDRRLMEAFHEGSDFHLATAALIFDVDEADVTASQRGWAKTVNFGVMYGMSPYGLARSLGVSTEEAAAFIDRYFETHPGVRDYTGEAIESALSTGYAVTILGRRRPITGLDSENSRVRGFAERAAVNTPIQGSAADLIKLAMIDVDRRIREDGLPCDMILQVHDELVFEVDEDAVDAVGAAVCEEMESPRGVELDVPLIANISHGDNWLEAH